MTSSRRRRAHGLIQLPELPSRVPAVVRSLARWAVLSSIGAVPACSARTTVPQAHWQPIGCDAADGFPPLFDMVELKGEPDYVGIYKHFAFSQIDSGGPRAYPISEGGESCSHAGDRLACETAVEREVTAPRCADGEDCAPFLLTTKGNQVTQSDDRAALIELLAPIDTGSKAVLLAMFDGVGFGCPSETSNMMLRGTETSPLDDSIAVRSEWEDCGVGLFRQTVTLAADGTASDSERVELGPSLCSVGRRPAGLCGIALQPRQTARTVGAALGAHFAHAARLEAASVYAFERLARELAALDAPRALIAEAMRSAADEVRHAHVTAALARRFGSEPITPVISELPERAPQWIALENAIEGCVRETYGALVAHHQAQLALDPAVRVALCAIAEDETRHAALSWQVASWLEPRLSQAQQQALQLARHAALAQLLREVDTGLSPDEARTIGWPSPELATAMITRLGNSLQI